jgi:hypothetical protein
VAAQRRIAKALSQRLAFELEALRLLLSRPETRNDFVLRAPLGGKKPSSGWDLFVLDNVWQLRNADDIPKYADAWLMAGFDPTCPVRKTVGAAVTDPPASLLRRRLRCDNPRRATTSMRPRYSASCRVAAGSPRWICRSWPRVGSTTRRALSSTGRSRITSESGVHTNPLAICSCQACTGREIIRSVADQIPVKPGADGVPVAMLALNEVQLAAASGSDIGMVAGACLRLCLLRLPRGKTR